MPLFSKWAAARQAAFSKPKSRAATKEAPSTSGFACLDWRSIATGMLLGSALLAQTNSAFAASDYIVRNDFGGNVFEYQERARALASQNVRVVIDGECQSACSLFLGSASTCVMPNAVVRLHAAKWTSTLQAMGMVRGEVATGPTRTLMQAYPRKLQSWITRHGGLTKNWLVLENQELQALVPPCSGKAPVLAGKSSIQVANNIWPAERGLW